MRSARRSLVIAVEEEPRRVDQAFLDVLFFLDLFRFVLGREGV